MTFNDIDFELGISKSSTETKELLQIDTEEGPSVTSAENGSESEPRRSGRIHRPLLRYGIDEYCAVNDESSHIACFAREPANLEEALSISSSKELLEYFHLGHGHSGNAFSRTRPKLKRLFPRASTRGCQLKWMLT